MTTAEKISIALPPEMVAIVRGAVATGEYASNSEVVRDALRDWTHKRSLRQQGVVELRQVWQEAMRDKRPGAFNPPKVATPEEAVAVNVVAKVPPVPEPIATVTTVELSEVTVLPLASTIRTTG